MEKHPKYFELLEIQIKAIDKMIRKIISLSSKTPLDDTVLQGLRQRWINILYAATMKKLLKGMDDEDFKIANQMVLQLMEPSTAEIYNFPSEKFSEYIEAFEKLKRKSKKRDKKFNDDVMHKMDYLMSKLIIKSEDDANHDKQNVDETFDCSNCSINPIDDDNDLDDQNETDIATCQFVNVKNRLEKWQGNDKNETKLIVSGKSYGLDELEKGAISWE